MVKFILNFFIKLFIYSTLFILRKTSQYYNDLTNYYSYIKNTIISSIKIIFNKGEENYIINNLNSIKKLPYHISIIITKENYHLFSLIKLISWVIYTKKVKCFTIYDPFNLTSSKKTESKDIMIKNVNKKSKEEHLNKDFKRNLKLIFKDKINLIHSNNEDECICSKKTRENNCDSTTNSNTDSNQLDDRINIIILNFKDSNNDLISDIVSRSINNTSDSSDKKVYVSKLPEITNKLFFEEEYLKNMALKKKEGVESLYTIKEAGYLPEVLLISNKNKSVFLYGFPFPMLQNCEIM